jgi:uncharacterized protein (DUF1800 family)
MSYRNFIFLEWFSKKCVYFCSGQAGMTISLSSSKKFAVLAVLGLWCAGISVDAYAKPRKPKPAPLTEQERAEHALDRLSFGPVPGEVEQVEAMGVDKWIALQLQPQTIDDSALDARLNAFPAMRLGLPQLMQLFPPNSTIRQIANGKRAMPGGQWDVNTRVEEFVYENALAGYRLKQEKKAQDGAGANAAAKPAGSMNAQAGAAMNAQPGVGTNSGMNPVADLAPNPPVDVAALLRKSPEDRWNAVLAMQPGTVRPFCQQLRGRERQELVAGWDPTQKEVLLAVNPQPERVVSSELLQERLLRAIYSQRQLNEVMTNFWLNHFNIYLRKNEEEPWYLTSFERDVIRPHAMGKFEDLLDAVAHSPAMLVYLDNQQSVGPDSIAAERGRQRSKAPDGLNENYGRELMELHTLGVNGGYTQADVIEVAKVLTGWGVGPQTGAASQVKDAFEFNERRHQPGPKTVLGKTIGENGEKEGDEVLHMLATSPATAHFLSTQLAEEFVSDTPPQALVDRMARTYLKSHGDIRQVLRTMLKSKEFWSRDAYRAKLKTPLEFVVSSVRATNADVENAGALVYSLQQLGMPLYGVQQPNGYSLMAVPWLGSESLLARMNFALALTSNRIPGVHVAMDASASAATDTASAGDDEAHLEDTLMDGVVAPHTHDAVLGQMDAEAAVPVAMSRKPAKPVDRVSLAAGLLLGSPDFQRR